MSQITTHILDLSTGCPAKGVAVVLEDAAGEELADGRTDADGRVSDLGPEQLSAGSYRLRFATAPYHSALGGMTSEPFFTEVTIAFNVAEGGKHYHVPLLLSPFGYSTYRGS